MKIPKKTNVKGQIWTTRYVWGLRCPENNERLDGLNLPKTRELLIDRGLPKEDKESAYIHELLHALFVESHLRGIVSIEAEEVIVSAIEEYLVGKLKL